MNINSSEKIILLALDWAYDKAIHGVIGLDSAAELAESYMKDGNNREQQANNLIRWQNTKVGTSGFITGLGGFLTLPITLPTNITTVTYIQIRMIAAIAHMGGHDIKDDRIRALVYICLTGNKAKEFFTDIGVFAGGSLRANKAKNINEQTISLINKHVGFSLLTTCGEKGMINLTKIFPFICGVIGATFDILSTNVIGTIAKHTFLEKSQTHL